jgi:hypothetical protein
MHEWLARAMQGIDPDALDASWQLFLRLFGMIPWVQLFWWNVAFVLVGALLGWWRGRTAEGVAWALVLGPIGWLVVLWRPRPVRQPGPPPLPRRR